MQHHICRLSHNLIRQQQHLLRWQRRSISTQSICCKNAFSSRTVYHEPISDEEAKRIVRKLSKTERSLISQQLQQYEREKGENGAGEVPTLTSNQVKALFAINCTPFIGFGFFDNFIMIIAGEYIDNTLGVMLGISTMAAAALGNLISDLAGVQLSLYIEVWCSKFGLHPPELTPEQTELPKTSRIIALGKLLGITIGCLIGMFPLLFIKNDDDEKEVKVTVAVTTTNDDVTMLTATDD